MYRFLLHVTYAYGLPICKPLEQEIKRLGYQVKWFSEMEQSSCLLRDTGDLLITPQDVIDYEPHVVLSATNIVPDFFPGIKVQIFHGFSINKRASEKGHFRVRGFFDLYCTQGPSTTIPFQKIAQELGYFEAVETGWSKVDPLFPIVPTQNQRPRILVSSTFTPKLSLAHSDQFITELKRLMDLDHYDWMITMHPLMDKDRADKFRALENTNVTFKDTTDLIPLFKQADLMIADTTSAIAEFLLQEKPVVTFNNNKPDNHLIDIQNPEQLESAIEKGLARPTDLMVHIKQFIADTHPYKDGHSSARVIDTCVDFLRKDKKHLKSKPLNLLRRLQIRKKYKFFTFRSYNKLITLK
ncbi:CDP-glycerol--glycerophosphate glycerophosphotransferase [Cellvibrio zantedeschiae]|uniref:CDP-glycerol--glycerophosphate glycerophosphotransferase n=1 Tax=Cellvibrio zantedeschiae TaxID=1237077 RepID=A0ABQ3AUK1_9GAMM|nr:CDP-glycerol glycerophosphotransferase family protein [Cellvibrio zantedeschiae]GGY64438.1 CDP-glycerol--glycerophosphate glycerophosphotransferase [Cellvibrio zantedeschiae]